MENYLATQINGQVNIYDMDTIEIEVIEDDKEPND